MLLEKVINCWRRSWRNLLRRAAYHQHRNALSYASRTRTANKRLDAT